jgi:hypothetical protein
MSAHTFERTCAPANTRDWPLGKDPTGTSPPGSQLSNCNARYDPVRDRDLIANPRPTGMPRGPPGTHGRPHDDGHTGGSAIARRLRRSEVGGGHPRAVGCFVGEDARGATVDVFAGRLGSRRRGLRRQAGRQTWWRRLARSCRCLPHPRGGFEGVRFGGRRRRWNREFQDVAKPDGLRSLGRERGTVELARHLIGASDGPCRYAQIGRSHALLQQLDDPPSAGEGAVRSEGVNQSCEDALLSS